MKMKKHLLQAFLCSAIWFAVSSSALATPFDIAGPPASDIDTNPATSVLLTTALQGTITDINVQLIINGSSWFSDLEVSLVHIATSILLADNVGSFASNQNYTFDDEAAAPLASEASGTFQPSPGSLSAFDGMNILGNWELQFLDTVIPDEGDELASWRIFGEYTPAEQQPIPEPTTMLLLGTGLVGVVGAARRKKKNQA